MTQHDVLRPGLIDALGARTAAVRLRAALDAGTRPHAGYVEALVARCAVEPDFFVRDMLTWALTRHEVSQTLPRLVVELSSPRAQARSQALHTLSKLKNDGAWPAVSGSLLHDPDDEVARAAWRAAVAVVPSEERGDLVAELAGELGRGDQDVQLSLSRALMALSALEGVPADAPDNRVAGAPPGALDDRVGAAPAAAPNDRTGAVRVAAPDNRGGGVPADTVSDMVAAARTHPDMRVRAHALATERLLADPDAEFGGALAEATRVAIDRAAPQVH